VPAAVAKIFEEKKQAIISGKLVPFTGPIVDQAGVVKVVAGAMMPMGELMSLNYYVQGVEGTIPK
jgi:simple sugar transport system substrate-binding protein